MAVIGKGSSSFKKQDVKEQKGIALGFKKVRFAHKASANDTGINLTALVAPAEMSTYGFTNPSVATLSAAQLNFYRNNLKLVSSLRGQLVDQLSYTVASSTQINFIDFVAEEGEIFIGTLDEAPTTSLSVVDGRQIVASGILTAGQTDFNIGTPITINQNPSSQIGAVMVFADRGLQYRKVGNVSTGDGDYIEVPVAGGLGSLIRFNASASDRFITVVSNGVVAERPDGSMMAAIERTQGQIDAMIPYLAAATGVATTTFQTSPNSVDLKQFGDTVLGLSTSIANLTAALNAYKNRGIENWRFQGFGGYPSGLFIPYFATAWKSGANIVATVNNSTSTGLTITANKRCKVTATWGKNNGGTNMSGWTLNATAAETQSGIDVNPSKIVGLEYISNSDSSSVAQATTVIILEVGDVLRPHAYDRLTGVAPAREHCEIVIEEL